MTQEHAHLLAAVYRAHLAEEKHDRHPTEATIVEVMALQRDVVALREKVCQEMRGAI